MSIEVMVMGKISIWDANIGVLDFVPFCLAKKVLKKALPIIIKRFSHTVNADS
jgi:hypothetical protein